MHFKRKVFKHFFNRVTFVLDLIVSGSVLQSAAPDTSNRLHVHAFWSLRVAGRDTLSFQKVVMWLVYTLQMPSSCR